MIDFEVGDELALVQQTAREFADAARFEAHVQSRSMEMKDAREGIAAMLQKREPDFEGR